MLKIEKNKILAPYTTLRIGQTADFFAIIKDKNDLLAAINWAKIKQQPIFVLGGGSNLLIVRRLPGLVLKNELKGITIKKTLSRQVLLSAQSGELWSKLVKFAVDHNFYGAENLFLIPGTVGGAPIQNIGAYGVELKDIFHSLLAINLRTGVEKVFTARDCHFAYRDSVFKKRLKGRYFIYAVTLKLQRVAQLQLAYGSITAELEKKNIQQPQLSDVIEVIQEIRNSKLPNPAQLPNAGSFFKNPEVSQRTFKKLLKNYPQLPHYPGQQSRIKLSAAWLIEQVGWKGRHLGPVGMYDKQALILINDGGANATQALALVRRVKKDVQRKFAIDLQAEVNII